MELKKNILLKLACNGTVKVFKLFLILGIVSTLAFLCIQSNCARVFLATSYRIVRTPSPNMSKLGLLKDHIKLTAKQHIHSFFSDQKTPMSAEILNFKVTGNSVALEWLFDEIFAQKCYLFHTTSPEPFIIDCGSNIGMSILFFKTLYPHAHIIGFEPDKQTFKILQENIENNHLDHVALYNQAVYSQNTNLTFFYNPDFIADPCQSLYSDQRGPRYTVEAVKISSFIHDTVDCLKIDVEGAEMHVMDDLVQNNKLHYVHQLIIEYHHFLQPKEKDHSLSKLFSYLDANGFEYQIAADYAAHKGRTNQSLLVYAFQKNE